ncbi:hypothetical protein [Calothrix sp. NIES-2100]
MRFVNKQVYYLIFNCSVDENLLARSHFPHITAVLFYLYRRSPDS